MSPARGQRSAPAAALSADSTAVWCTDFTRQRAGAGGQLGSRIGSDFDQEAIGESESLFRLYRQIKQ